MKDQRKTKLFSVQDRDVAKFSQHEKYLNLVSRSRLTRANVPSTKVPGTLTSGLIPNFRFLEKYPS